MRDGPTQTKLITLGLLSEKDESDDEDDNDQEDKEAIAISGYKNTFLLLTLCMLSRLVVYKSKNR